MEYLTDIVKEEDYEMWPKSSSLIFLFSQTGTGKTTLSLAKVALSFIKREKNNDNENKSEEEKERENNNIVLYLVPRTILKEQIENDKRLIFAEESINETPEYNLTFHIWTYRHLEDLLLDNKEIPSFDLIICDEMHYFMADSLFNAYTQLSYDYIFKRTESPRLLLTATPDDIMHYMTENILFKPILPDIYYSITIQEKEAMEYDINDIFHEPTPEDKKRSFNLRGNVSAHTAHIYRLPKNYNYINTKYLTEYDKEYDNIIEIIKNTHGKTIIFISSKQRGGTLKENLDKNKIDNVFITADNKYTDTKETVAELAENHQFIEKVLITTSVLDVGVSIEDDDVDNIIIETTEYMEFLQMLGRIRLKNPEKRINLFIFKWSYKYFQKLRKNIKEKMKCCEYLEEYEKYNENHFLEGILENELHPKKKKKLPRGYKNYLYLKDNGGFGPKQVPALNKLAIYYLRRLYLLYNDICKKIQKDDNYFIKKQLEWLGREDDFSDANFYSLELQKRHIQILQAAIESKSKEIKNGIPLKNRTEILAFFQPLVRNIDSKFIKNNVKLSMPKFNKFCEKHNIPYKFIKEKDKVTRREVYYLRKINLTSQLINEFNSL